MEYQSNKFVSDLLSLQQDGEKSISGPKCWEKDNVLDIETSLTDKVVNISSRLMNDDSPLWHFYIGAPGNGKSHLVGMLYKKLIDDGWVYKVQNDEIEYVYEWYRAGEKFSRLWFVQDASAVRDTFDTNADEVKDLAEVLKAAWEKGVSVIVCANRGILERVREEQIPKNKEGWFSAVKRLLEERDEGDELSGFNLKNKTKAELTRDSLDISSLFYDEDASIALKILNDVIHKDRWDVCTSCKANKVCPFKLNRDCLAVDKWKHSFLNTVKNGEIIRGQIIVFREFLSLVSSIFSGSSDDSKSHPCDWVKKLDIDKNYAVLLSKRFYMQLFSSVGLTGLDIDENLKSKQIFSLQEIISKDSELSTLKSKQILQSFLDFKDLPSKDLGIDSLIGKSGSITIQDPFNSNLDFDFITKWTIDNTDLIETIALLPGDMSLEIKVFQFMIDTIQWVDDNNFETANDLVNTILRWSSSFSMRLGGMSEERTYFYNSLKEFSSITGKLANNEAHSSEIYKSIWEIEDKLNRVLSRVTNSFDNNELRISEVLKLSGSAISEVSQLKVNYKNIKPPYIRLPCTFGENESDDVHVYLSGIIFCWLDIADSSNMIPRTIPQSILESILQARARSISKSNYSRSSKDIIVNLEDLVSGKKFVMNGRDSVAIVEEESIDG